MNKLQCFSSLRQTAGGSEDEGGLSCKVKKTK